jgi:hypothetical protein
MKCSECPAEVVVARGLCRKCYARDYNIRTREQRKAWQRKWDKANPDRLRAIKLRSKYGMTVDAFNAMRAMQEDSCAICLSKETLVVDHCHLTGVVRGLLCSRCNLMIGQAKDSTTVLRLAADYLQRFE